MSTEQPSKLAVRKSERELKTVKRGRRKPVFAGIIILLSGILLILLGLVYSLMVASLLMMVCLTLLGIMAILGGYYAIRRRRWRTALVGAICATIVPLSLAVMDYTGLIVFGAFALAGIGAVILIILSRKDFVA